MISLPDGVYLVLPFKRHPHARLVHVAHEHLTLTLCSRVRPGRPVALTPLGYSLCSRCASRVQDLYGTDT